MPFITCVTALLLALVFLPVAAGTGETVDWSSIDAERRREVIMSTPIDKIEFKDYSLLQCLKAISNKAWDVTGRSFSITIQGTDPQPDRVISMQLHNITIKEVLELLAAASESKIEMTQKGCVVTFENEYIK